MANTAINTGTETGGDDINWHAFEIRENNDISSKLMEQTKNEYIENKNEIKNLSTTYDLSDYLNCFNAVVDKKYKFSFTLPIKVIVEDDQKNKNKKNKKVEKKKTSELIIEKQIAEKKEKDLQDFSNSLSINLKNPNMPVKNNKYIESFFSVVFWAIYLKYMDKKHKKEPSTYKKIEINYYLNCATSLNRAIEDSKNFLNEININEAYALLNSLEEIIRKNINTNLYENILDNLSVIIDSYWDQIKPKSICLYKEQRDIIELVTENLNEKKLIFFEMPPANGKTFLSAMISKVIHHKNNINLKNIPGYKRKTLLYICYNTIVRNEVGKLCNSINVDVKFWLAVTKTDRFDGKVKTFLRPFKTSYPDWNQKGMRSVKEKVKYNADKYKKFSENIHEQWEYMIKDTLPIRQQNNEIDDYLNAENIP